VRAWALVELGDHEAIDVFRKEDALKALEDTVSDEPHWIDNLLVTPSSTGRSSQRTDRG
jgi:hypothetical protein